MFISLMVKNTFRYTTITGYFCSLMVSRMPDSKSLKLTVFSKKGDAESKKNRAFRYI